MDRIAVVMFNLGGPDRPEAVKPFLFNLFNDPAIMRQPGLVRWMLAKLISGRRAPVAREIYDKIGGRSPILPETEAQEAALAAALDDDRVRTFVCMRYWHPMTERVVAEVREYAPDLVVLLPLYPQFSGSTTGSSFRKWNEVAEKSGLRTPTARLCCYPDAPGFVRAVADQTRRAIAESPPGAPPRVLFSAHGLPKKFVETGDPYQNQVERTVAAVVEELAIDGLDYVTCYQSRVGPLEWLKPYTEDEILRAGAEKRPLVVVPVAFVSEHSETLVELDMEYGELARDNGVPSYIRVPAVGVHPAFIGGLAESVRRIVDHAGETLSDRTERLCPAGFGDCPFSAASQRKAA